MKEELLPNLYTYLKVHMYLYLRHQVHAMHCVLLFYPLYMYMLSS